MYSSLHAFVSAPWSHNLRRLLSTRTIGCVAVRIPEGEEIFGSVQTQHHEEFCKLTFALIIPVYETNNDWESRRTDYILLLNFMIVHF